MEYRYLFLVSLFFISVAHADSDTLWTDISPDAVAQTRAPSKQSSLPDTYRLKHLDENGMRDKLTARNNSFARKSSRSKTKELEIPLPNGQYLSLQVKEISSMAPELAAKYPQIRTFQAESEDNDGIYGVLDLTEQGFHAMLFMQDGTRLFIDPRKNDDETVYIIYYDKDYHPSGKKSYKCDVESHNHHEEVPGSISYRMAHLYKSAQRSGNQLRTYRLAMATTGEYTAFHGGTVIGALGAMTTTVNRVNAIYQRDLAVKLELVGNTDLLIRTDTTTYTNNDGLKMLDENQTQIDSIISSVNYDIGHVVSTAGGGIATLGVVCDSNYKARGVTGQGHPETDVFDIDYVAHEIGHQFGGNHTFNSTTGACDTNRSQHMAFEPGSGSTIMGYAGICDRRNNIQLNSDAMFHVKSIEQINKFIDNSRLGGSCGTTSSLNNQQPVSNAGEDYTIPAKTPFKLTGTGSDPDGNTLTYSWEQIDSGAESHIDIDTTDNAIFRSFLPKASATRTFPKFNSILNNATSKGETLPIKSRNINFSLAVRDGKGGIATDQMVVTINGSTPFHITSHDTAETISGNTLVTWDVANTNSAPISCSNVNILLTTNAGATFTDLSGDTPNDGSENITIPVDVNESTTARFKIKCSNNIFFDISDTNLTTLSQANMDTDNDGFTNDIDNCPSLRNARQSDENNDGAGDMCTPYQLPSNKWLQISIPADLINTTVADVFADDLPAADLGTKWAIFSYNSAEGIYNELGLSDKINQGEGYWIVQITGNTVNIDLPATAQETQVQQSNQCTSTSGCYEIILQAVANNGHWSILGYPFEHSLNSLNKVRIVTNSGVCADDDGCTLDEASTAKIFLNKLWSYNGTTYDSLTPASKINSWAGAWGRTLENSNGVEVRLLIPVS